MTIDGTLLRLVPVTLKASRIFVGTHHRHNLAPNGGLVAVGAQAGDRLVGVAILGKPIARALDDGTTAEITRLCVLPEAPTNTCSMLYGALWRAARALGYRRIYTYTLASEPGTSLRAAGFQLDAELPARSSWNTPSRPRHQTDLFGNDRRPPGPKVRWTKKVA